MVRHMVTTDDLLREAVVQCRRGDLDAACRRYRQILASTPRHPRALSELGAVRFAMGDPIESEKLLRRAVALAPRAAVPRFNLGVMLHRTDRPDEAAEAYGACIAADPNHAAAHAAMGDLHHVAKRYDQAIAAHLRACALEPSSTTYLSALAGDLPFVNFVRYSAELEDLLHRVMIGCPGRPAQSMGSIATFLTLHPAVQTAITMAADDATAEDVYQAVVEDLSTSRLLRAFLSSEIVRSMDLEAALTTVRQGLLEATLEGRRHPTDRPFAVALALQCHLTEFVMNETEAERLAIDHVRERLASWANLEASERSALITAFVLYRSLDELVSTVPYDELAPDEHLLRLLEVHVAEPAYERELEATIESLSAIDDATSQVVRAQYEANPYPRWVAPLVPPPATSYLQGLAEAIGDEEAARTPDAAAPQILIAGCGTGRHALLTAGQFQTAEIIAFDISRRSLAYAMRKTREAGVDRIRYLHGDILQAHALGRQFDIVESVGVLHHLRDPLTGWRVLRGLVRPGGLMCIGLYSAAARKPINDRRERISTLGLTADSNGIRAGRASVHADARAGDPTAHAIAHSKDFCSTSGCRDLLFHVQEQSLDLPTIGRWLEELDLDFLCFHGDPVNWARHAARNPKALESLDFWIDYEAAHPLTFVGMYQFWCRARH